MTNILTAAEAAATLRCAVTDALMLSLLPSVDSYLGTATGHDWTTDSPIVEQAKAAARMLLTLWYENPAMLANGQSVLSFGLTAVLVQLEALALRYKTFAGLDGAGSISVPGAQVGDTVASLIGVVGVSGDQRANFESVVTVANQLQQSASGDLSANFYRAYLVPAAEK